MTEQEKRIIHQREEIRKLQEHIHNLTQSRDYWKAKAERVGKQLHKVLNDRRTSENAKEIMEGG